MQLELVLQTPERKIPELILRNIAYSAPVKITGSGRIVMKVKPTGFLLNNTIVGDMINRGDVMVVALQEGTVYAMRGTTPVTEIVSKMQYSAVA